MVVRRLPEASELYHHGILGQKWGVRRFQNRDGSLTSAGRKRRGLVEQIKYNRKMKKVRKAKVEKAKEQQRIKEEQTKRLQKVNAERRERAEVIKTGSAKDIQKFQHKMSDKEYEKALQRVQLTQTLNDYVAAQSQAKAAKIQARLNTAMNVARTASDVATSAANVYSALEKVGVIKKKEQESALDKLRKQKERMGLELDIADLKYEKDNNARRKKANTEIEKLDAAKKKLGLELDVADLKYQKEQSKKVKRPDELEQWRREADITKAMADVAKNNRIIEGKGKTSDISIDDLRSLLDEEFSKRGM